MLIQFTDLYNMTSAYCRVEDSLHASKQLPLFKKKKKFRSRHPDLFLRKGVLKICSKFTWEHHCQSAISIKFLCNFLTIAFGLGVRSPVNLLHIFRTPFLRTALGGCFWKLKLCFCVWTRMTWPPISESTFPSKISSQSSWKTAPLSNI